MTGFVPFPAVGGDDGTLTDDGTGTTLPDNDCHVVLIQADPANSDNVLIGLSTTPTISLEPGDDIALAVENTNMIHVEAVSGTQTINFTYFVR